MHTSGMYARETHALEVHANEMHAHETHAREMHAHKIHAHEMHACEMHAGEMHVCKMHVCKMHACEMDAYEVYTYEVYTRDFDLSLTAPMSCRTGCIPLCWMTCGPEWLRYSTMTAVTRDLGSSCTTQINCQFVYPDTSRDRRTGLWRLFFVEYLLNHIKPSWFSTADSDFSLEQVYNLDPHNP